VIVAAVGRKAALRSVRPEALAGFHFLDIFVPVAIPQ
jgi:hypothetical protein